ncbi:MAG TPA: class I tRNA ligase family protein, partial [Caulobacteraceae bacterium]|nr:class I tRNA ligase family protein [Caulobacteraceae bacterium]
LINRIWAEFDEGLGDPEERGDAAASLDLRRATHKAIKAVTEAIEGFRFNSAIARLYEFVAAARDARLARAASVARREALSALARLVAPFAPHLAEECWQTLGESGLLALAPWPAWDPALADDDERILPVQINGKRRGEVRAPAGASAGEVEKLVFENAEIARRLEGVTVRKVIVVPDRIVNLVVA